MKKQLLILLSIIGLTESLKAQSVTIDPRNTATNIIDAKSNNQGMSVPKMMTAQKGAIATKTEGMLVYDTDAKQFSYWTGTTWVNFGNSVTAGPGWSQIGNDISNSNSGNVGIGTSVPTARLNVKADGSGYLQENVSGSNKFEIKLHGTGGVAQLRSLTGDVWLSASKLLPDFRIAPNGNVNMAEYTTGKVGIGVLTPKKRLDINGAIKVSGAQHESLIRLNNSNFNLSFNRDHQMANDLSNIRNIRIELTTLPITPTAGCGSHTPYEIYLPPYDQLTYPTQELRDYHDYTGQVITFFLAESNLKAIGDTRVDISSSIGDRIRVKTIATIRHYGSCHPFGTKPSVNFVKIMFDGTEWIAIEN